MSAVLSGFFLLGLVVAIGYVIGRSNFLGPGADVVLSKLSFAVATPALLFMTLYDADLGTVISEAATTAILAAVVTGVAYVVIARRFLRRPGTETVIGSWLASYVNVNNLGIPLLTLVAGTAAPIAPVLLFQVLVLLPIGFLVLDGLTGRGGNRWRLLLLPVLNPLVVAVLLGLLFAVAGWTPPALLQGPLEMLGAAAIPLMLVAFGISLRGAPVPGRGEDRGAMVLAVSLKSAVAPMVAVAIGAGVFGLGGTELLIAAVLAALPSAQNIFVHAVRYGVSVGMARETILLTTVLSLPVVLLVAAILGT